MTDLTPNKICRYRCVKEQASPDYVRGFTSEELKEILTKLVQLEHIISCPNTAGSRKDGKAPKVIESLWLSF